jgi:hypothetical protein
MPQGFLLLLVLPLLLLMMGHIGGVWQLLEDRRDKNYHKYR